MLTGISLFSSSGIGDIPLRDLGIDKEILLLILKSDGDLGGGFVAMTYTFQWQRLLKVKH